MTTPVPSTASTDIPVLTQQAWKSIPQCDIRHLSKNHLVTNKRNLISYVIISLHYKFHTGCYMELQVALNSVSDVIATSQF
ncbi:UNVERIFIED_CONTAM: hypothetical protein NCL1_13486 [Trichonephila clavipes]